MSSTMAGAMTVASEEPEELGELLGDPEFELGELLGDPENETGELEKDTGVLEKETGVREKEPETEMGERGVMRDVWKVVGMREVLREVGMREVAKVVGMEMPPKLRAEAQAITARKRTREVFCIVGDKGGKEHEAKA